jgi:hypothetical protein
MVYAQPDCVDFIINRVRDSYTRMGTLCELLTLRSPLSLSPSLSLSLKWKYIQYPPQATSREDLRAKMREIARDD